MSYFDNTAKTRKIIIVYPNLRKILIVHPNLVKSQKIVISIIQ